MVSRWSSRVTNPFPLRRARGLYNPHTLHGDVVVDGVLTSTYTGVVHPALAHALLAPLRQLYSAGLSFGTNVAWGAKQLPAWVKDAVRGD